MLDAPGNILTSVCIYSLFLVNIAVAGHLGDEKILAGVSISTAVINMTLFAVSFGINYGTELATAKAFKRQDLDLCVDYLNQGRFVNLIFAIPVAFTLLYCSEGIFRALGTEEAVAGYGHTYTTSMLLGCLISQMNVVSLRWLVQLGDVWGAAILSVLALTFHILACSVFTIDQ